MPRRLSIALIAALFSTSLARGDADESRRRGLEALAFIDAHFKLDRGLYADQFTPGGKRAGNAACWGTGVMLSSLNAAAALDPKRIAAAHAYAVALDAYQFQPAGEPVGYQPFPGNKPDELFYDDNAWLILGFVDTYQLTHDPADLKRATIAFDYVASGESADLGGGIWWSSERKTKNTCSNAPAACGALALYEVTNDKKYLDAGQRWLAWVGKLQAADGLFFDNIDRDGKIEKTKWSYNSALVIRANTMLFRITKDQKYLAEANRIADAAEAHWFKDDGTIVDGGAFAHLLCEALLMLNDVSPRHATVTKVTAALDHLATLRHGGAYPDRWDGWKKGEVKIGILQQASAARAFLFAAKRTPTTVPAR